MRPTVAPKISQNLGGEWEEFSFLRSWSATLTRRAPAYPPGMSWLSADCCDASLGRLAHVLPGVADRAPTTRRRAVLHRLHRRRRIEHDAYRTITYEVPAHVYRAAMLFGVFSFGHAQTPAIRMLPADSPFPDVAGVRPGTARPLPAARWPRGIRRHGNPVRVPPSLRGRVSSD